MPVIKLADVNRVWHCTKCGINWQLKNSAPDGYEPQLAWALRLFYTPET